MNAPQNKAADGLIEALAEIEHEQWTHWSQAVSGDVTETMRKKWQRSWVTYAELPDHLKESDRVWSPNVVALLQQRRLIP